MRVLIPITVILISSAPGWALSDMQRTVIWTRCWDSIRCHFTGFDEKQFADWDKNYESNLHALTSAPSDAEFWFKLQQIISSLGDGRTWLQPPTLLPVYDTVPIRFIIADGKIFVKQLGASPEVQSSGVHIGDELIEVDHQPVMERVQDECLPFVSGSTKKGRMASAIWRVLYGKSNQPIHLVFHKPSGQEYSLILKRDSGSEGKFFTDLMRIEGRFARKLPGSVLYLEIGQWFSANDEFAVVGQLEENPKTKCLILDLRQTKYGIVPTKILQKLALFPLPMGTFREVEWTTTSSPDDRATIRSKRLLLENQQQMIEPDSNVFRGQVIILVGPETSGPAEQFLEPLYYANRVTLIGDTTAGAGGQSIHESFDGGGSLFVTAREPQWENRFGAGVGFPPRVYVVPTAKGLGAGKDEVLQRALDFIHERAE